MLRGAAALPSLSRLALHAPVVPTGVSKKRQKTSAAYAQVVLQLRRINELLQQLPPDQAVDWGNTFIMVAENEYGKLLSTNRADKKRRQWIFWDRDEESGTMELSIKPIPMSENAPGTLDQQWSHTLEALAQVESRVNATRKRQHNEQPLRELVKSKRQKKGAPNTEQRDRVAATQLVRGKTRAEDREQEGQRYFNKPEGARDAPTFVPPTFEGPQGGILRDEVRRKWPQDLKEQLRATRDPDGGCCAAED
jgi:hypothetical protein